MRLISYIEFENLTKIYKGNNNETIKDFNLSIEKGEFIAIVGASGSGKSTLLELICGFEEITRGTIKIDNKIINEVAPKDRDVSMIFQNYAIYPHLSVYENIAFGMKIRKVNKKESDEKVRWASNILELDNYLNKKPSELSGGQRQRVAIGRAMVRNPKLFLMDEPLSNLDAKLRDNTSNEIVKLHKRINATTIYVTHDQGEALTMADKIVVLDKGTIQQVGTPMDIYTNPRNLFVASFIGKPSINTFEVRFSNQKLIINDTIGIDIDHIPSFISTDTKYILGIRPENILINKDENSLKAAIYKVEYLGGEMILYLKYQNTEFKLKTYEVEDYIIGQQINVSFILDKAIIFDIPTKENIGRVRNEKKIKSN